MKKILIAFLLLFVPFMVYAVEADDYDYVWSVDYPDTSFTKNYDYKDGYLFIEYDSNVKFNMSYYDKNGKLLKQKKLDEIAMGVKTDEYIYVIIERLKSNTEMEAVIQAYDENLELVNEATLMSVFGLEIDDVSEFDLTLEDIKDVYETGPIGYLFNIKEDKIITIGIQNTDVNSQETSIPNFEIRTYTKDLSSYEATPINVDDIGNTAEAEAFYVELLGLERMPITTDEELTAKIPSLANSTILDFEDIGDYIIVRQKKCQDNERFRDCLKVFDAKTYELVFSIEVNFITRNVEIVNGYLILGLNVPENYNDTSLVHSIIQIYDLKTAKLLSEINNGNRMIVDITSTKRGFIIDEKTCETIYDPDYYNVGNHHSGKILPTYLKTQICSINKSVYHYFKQVETKVASGKGQIIVDKRYSPNDPVTFTIVPEKGYVLSSVKVTDANGNVITFTDYTFTMPDANVLIEATFVTNPNTSSFISYLVIVLGGIAFITTYLLIQKKKALKIKW